MNILDISNFFAELFADGGLYLCLLAAMGVAVVLFIIIALLIPKRCFKSKANVKEESKQKKVEEEQMAEVEAETVNQQEEPIAEVKTETSKEFDDDEQVPTVKQVLGEVDDEYSDGEPVIEATPLDASSGRAEPVLSFEQIISGVKPKNTVKRKAKKKVKKVK